EEVRFVVAKVVTFDQQQEEEFAARGFVVGVEVTYWNGTPIRRAVDLHAEHETGGRPDARLARAIESMTIRPLRYGLAPDEHWVSVYFVTADGTENEIRIDWRLAHLGAVGTEPQSANPGALGPRVYAGNLAAEASRRAKTLMFATDVWRRS